jgi:hypothetical protein
MVALPRTTHEEEVLVGEVAAVDAEAPQPFSETSRADEDFFKEELLGDGPPSHEFPHGKLQHYRCLQVYMSTIVVGRLSPAFELGNRFLFRMVLKKIHHSKGIRYRPRHLFSLLGGHACLHSMEV